LRVTRAKKVNKLYLPLHSTPKAHTDMLGTHSRPFTHVQHCRAHARAADVLSRNTTTGFGRTRYNGICKYCVCKLHARRCAAPECNAIAAHALYEDRGAVAWTDPSVIPRTTITAVLSANASFDPNHSTSQMNWIGTLRRRFDFDDVPVHASCVILYPPPGFLRCSARHPKKFLEPWVTVG
jgi:hypothetical protein